MSNNLKDYVESDKGLVLKRNKVDFDIVVVKRQSSCLNRHASADSTTPATLMYDIGNNGSYYIIHSQADTTIIPSGSIECL